MMKEPEVAIHTLPDDAKGRMPAKWARDTRFYLTQSGLFAVRADGCHRWTGRSWSSLKCRPDWLEKNIKGE